MTFVSWRHPAPDERSGQPHLWTHNKESQGHQCCHMCLLQDLDEEPVVKQLTSDPVEIKADHFSQPLCGSDSSHAALNFPIPEVRYLIKEISVVWHLYGGKDFRSAALTASPSRSRGWANSCSDVHALKSSKEKKVFDLLLIHFRSTPHSSPSQTPVRQAKSSSRIGGGRGRNNDVLMEIQLSKVRLFTWNICLGLYIYHCYIPSVWPSPLIRFSFDLFKVRFQHDVYPQARGASGPAADQPVSRQVFVVQDLEIRDRLAASQMNKFLYLYSSKEMPRKSHSNMVRKPSHSQSPVQCWQTVISWMHFLS